MLNTQGSKGSSQGIANLRSVMELLGELETEVEDTGRSSQDIRQVIKETAGALEGRYLVTGMHLLVSLYVMQKSLP